jgi:hypothetical protein
MIGELLIPVGAAAFERHHYFRVEQAHFSL